MLGMMINLALFVRNFVGKGIKCFLSLIDNFILGLFFYFFFFGGGGGGVRGGEEGRRGLSNPFSFLSLDMKSVEVL